mmetsp:Transcript_21841/g.56192  ORF Transcript_21841/g.56192 Transcript_21841/m.56192 type:complete len:203 (-) Transcript_21841:3158-3766(-)
MEGRNSQRAPQSQGSWRVPGAATPRRHSSGDGCDRRHADHLHGLHVGIQDQARRHLPCSHCPSWFQVRTTAPQRDIVPDSVSRELSHHDGALRVSSARQVQGHHATRACLRRRSRIHAGPVRSEYACIRLQGSRALPAGGSSHSVADSRQEPLRCKGGEHALLPLLRASGRRQAPFHSLACRLLPLLQDHRSRHVHHVHPRR